MPDAIIEVKSCSVCGVVRSLADFHKSHRSSDGRLSQCKMCDRARGAAYRAKHRDEIIAYLKEWRVANPEKMRAAQADYYAANRDRVLAQSNNYHATNREKRNEQHRAYYAANRDRLRKTSAAWREAHRDYLRAKAIEYRKANPDWKRSHNQLRKARKRAAEGSWSPSDIRDIRRLQKDKCAVCSGGLRKKGEVDHIIPLSKGGTNYRRNLQLLCNPCNNSKNARDPIEFMQSLGLLL